ncbi:PGF-CTERM sorting domain-containing protein [Haloferax sp. Atlit-12N]|uniref:ArtA-dependent S-layer glycoprotein n=1 Tax=Haloferax sp. Atlit-12N TaxID=2077203 RepID=UPI000E2629CB|nr:ArtA-dependent S-layer glycoprotein [Haloferax sp. Atlit-12N]RDZ65365.1 PGF-CTERM sorting domain-containing protein [Haloferax sp. Atlit-12N]
MTANKQVRAVLLAALMVFSVFAGSIAFTGTAAAAATSATVSSDTVDKGPSATVDVTVNSGGTNDVHVWLDLNDDGYYNASEPSSTDNPSSTATLSLSVPENVSTGEYNVSAAESASLTAGTTQQEAYDTLDVVAANPADFSSAIHYDDGTPKVEVAFDEDVTVNEMNVTDGETNLSQSASVSGGQVNVTLSQVYTEDLEVTYNVTDSSGNTASATEDVTFAPIYVANESNNTAYQGSNVAVVASATDTDVEVEGVDDDNNYQFSGSTGPNSQVFVFDTDGKTLDTYKFTVGGVQKAQVDVRDLGFELTVDDLNITTKDGLEGSVSANAGDRTIDVVALDDDGDEVDGTETTVTLDGQGEADFNLSSVDAGEYTIEATDAFSGVTLESDTVTVSKAKDSTGDFTSSVINEQVGDVAEITVTLDGTDTGTVTIGDYSLGYSANVTVEDGNDDGEVTLLFNSYAPKKTSSFDVDDSDDEYTVDDITTEIPSGETLDAGDYDLEVATGGEADNVATLVLEDRSTESVTTWTAPTGADITETEDVYDAIENENLTQTDSLANGDVVVTQVSATGLEGAFDASNFDALSGTQFNLTVEQTNPGPNRDAKVLGINSSSATIIADGDNDTYFIVYDLDDVSASRTDYYDNTSTLYEVEDDDAFNATFTVLEDGELAEDDESASDEFEVVTPELSLDEDEFAVSNAAEQSISGTATVAPGTELTIRVTSDGDTQPRFLKTASVYVQADGTFSSAFDFSEQNLNDTFEVTASVDSGTADDATADGTVGEAMETTTAAETTTTEESTETTTTEASTEETTETATATEEPTEEPTEETTESSTPGFGVVVALVALVAAALLAVRRDN